MFTKLAEELMKEVIMMLGTFPKTFSQATTSQGYFPKRQLPEGIFPCGYFPTMQFPERQLI